MLPDRQRISIKYQPKPAEVFNKNGNRYAKFVFVEPEEHFEVKMNVKAEIFQYDLSTAKKKQKKTLSKGSSFEKFLEHEKYIEKNSKQIQQIADTISGGTDLELVENIYNYVIDNME